MNNERYTLFGNVIGHAYQENITTITLTTIENAGHIMYQREGYTADQIVERKEMELLQEVLEALAFPRVYTEPKTSVPVIRAIMGMHGKTRKGIDILVQDITGAEQQKTLQLTLQYR